MGNTTVPVITPSPPVISHSGSPWAFLCGDVSRRACQARPNFSSSMARSVTEKTLTHHQVGQPGRTAHSGPPRSVTVSAQRQPDVGEVERGGTYRCDTQLAGRGAARASGVD